MCSLRSCPAYVGVGRGGLQLKQIVFTLYILKGNCMASLCITKATFTKALCKYECFTLCLVELIFAVFSPPIVMWADDSVLMLIKYLCSLPEANGDVTLDRVAFLR